MRIAFVSTRNAVRSIMAESVAMKVSKLALLSPDIYSAGVEPVKEIPKEIIELLEEKGYPTEGLHPKDISAIPYKDIDILITLSPEARDRCPYLETHLRREHWTVEEAATLKKEELLKILEQIEKHVRELFKIS
ncbi:MAG: low molecular weight phosphatase family protein [Aquificaceae bacterium]